MCGDLNTLALWGVMCSPKEFRDFSLRCMRLADEARDAGGRQLLLEMAAYWMRAAVYLERPIVLLDSVVPLVPEKET